MTAYIELTQIHGDRNIGMFMVATERYALVTCGTTPSFIKIAVRVLNVPVYEIEVDTRIIGALIAANENGIILSYLFADSLLEDLQQQFTETLPDLKIGKISSGYFAVGNLMVSSNKQSLVSPLLSHEERTMISDVLGTEISTIRIAGSDLVGSLLKITKTGGIISPIVDNEDEIENIQSLLNIQIESSTVNRGFQFPAGGFVANSYGAIIGNLTTGIETIAITRGLFPQED